MSKRNKFNSPPTPLLKERGVYKWSKMLLLGLFMLLTLASADILDDVKAKVNQYNYLSADYQEYNTDTGDFMAAPIAGQYATANYTFAKYGINNEPAARLEYEYPVTEIVKIANGNIYSESPSGDYLVSTLTKNILFDPKPGFETFLLDNMEVVTFNEIITDNYIVTVNCTISSNISQIVLSVSDNLLVNAKFLISGNILIRTIFFEYLENGGYYFLVRTGVQYGDAVDNTRVKIRRFLLPDNSAIGNSDFVVDLAPADVDDDDDDDSEFPNPGNDYGFNEGSKLSPFNSYGVAGEKIPGSSGALQLSYTDLHLPGINGLDLTIKRTYLSQQMNSNPKPNSFRSDPFRVKYAVDEDFPSDYKLISPDGWGGWMGHGWQTNIGGELYINEVRSFTISGPIFPPAGDAVMETSTQRSYTFQTADGMRADFMSSHEAKAEKTIGAGSLCDLGSNYTFISYYRDQLEMQGDLEAAPTMVYSADKRNKMKLEIVSNDHYVVYGPNGTKYHFELKIFEKEAQWQKDWQAGSIFSGIRAFVGLEYKTKVFYLTRVEDINGNEINYQYQQLFSNVTAENNRRKNDSSVAAEVNLLNSAGVYTKLVTYMGMPTIPFVGTAIEFLQTAQSLGMETDDTGTVNDQKVGTYSYGKMLLINSAWDMALSDGSLKIEDVLSKQIVATAYQKYLTGPAVDFVFTNIGKIPYIPLKYAAFAAATYMMEAQISSTKYRNNVKYSMSGYRPIRIVDTMGRAIELDYRSVDNPSSIKDSQIKRIRYKDPNGNNVAVEYNYDNNDNLIEVKYPGDANPINYEYTWKDAGLADVDYHDRGYLLTTVHHPSGFASNYEYEWYEPYKDLNSFGIDQLSPGENKDYSYYIVKKKTHTGIGVAAREWDYAYKRGSVYQLYAGDPSNTSRRWNFKECSVTDPLDKVTRTEYIIGQVESIHYPTIAEGTMWETHHRTLNEYDIVGGTYQLLHTMTFKNTTMHEKFFEYDPYGQIAKITDMGFYKEDDPLDQRITYIEYDDTFHDRLTDPNIYGLVDKQWIEEPSKNSGVKYGYVDNDYNGRGLLTSSKQYYTAGDYIENRYDYDSFGNMTDHWDGKNNHTQMTYQFNAYPYETIKTVGANTFTTQQTNSQYNGAVLSSTDENGYHVDYEYDALGRKIREIHPDATAINTTYLDSQYRTEVRDRKARTTVYNYNPFGELSTIRDPLNNTTTYQTDGLGRLKTIRLADNREYSYQYDEIGRPIRVNYPDGTFSRKAYEDGNNSILVWDENDHGMEYWYDVYGNLTKVVRGDIQEPGTIHYDYEYNYLTKITSPKDFETTFSNDLLGRRLSKTLPNGDTEYFHYDANSNLDLHTNYENKPINFGYDDLNRVEQETYQDSNFNVAYTYDNGANALGRLTRVDDNSGYSEYKYNNLGLITEETKNLDGANYVTKYIFDNTGLLTSIEYPQVNGRTVKVNYVYDTLDRIDQVRLQINGGAEETIIDNTYDNVGRLTSRDYGNGLDETFSYDSKDRLTEHDVKKSNNDLVFNYKYTYDKAGNITRRDIKDTNNLMRRDSYEYDYINQLKKVDVPGAKDLEFNYDRDFNREYMIHGFGRIDYTYDPQGMNLLQSWKEDYNSDGSYEMQVEYDYSKQGNPLYKVYRDLDNNAEVSREDYTWNDRDELTAISARVTNNFTYDYRGLRCVKDNDGKVYKYVYLQNSLPALKINEAENYTDVFVYEGDKRIQRIRITSGGDVEQDYFMNDYLGNVVAVIDDDENIEWQNYADAWGNMEMCIGNPSKNAEFSYTSKELDNTGLYYFGARFVDPLSGRFPSRDKVKLEDDPKNYFGVNPYVFCSNNPMRYVDPDGNRNTGAANFARNMLNNGKFSYGKYGTWQERMYTNLSDRDRLVCNEYVMFAYRGSGSKNFPYATKQWKDGIVSQMDWFSQRGELFPVNSTEDLNKLTNFGEGDVIFFSEDGTSKTVGHVIMVDNYNPKTGEITFMGAHSKGSGVGAHPQKMTITKMQKAFKTKNISVGSNGSEKKGMFSFFSGFFGGGSGGSTGGGSSTGGTSK